LNAKPPVILDPIGGPTRAANVERLARHGRLIVYGNIASWDPHLASTNDLLMNGQSLMTYNSNLLSQTHPDRLATSARAALALVAAGTITIEPTTEYPIEETSHALSQLAAGNTLGKSILRIAP
jgi:NADPH2:quinone reductase